jgi:type IV pilus assembly protein PilY1
MTIPPDDRTSTRPRRPDPRWPATGALMALLFAAGTASAQNDVMQPAPNVLLLVDTSGSMEYRTGSSQFPSCKYKGTTTTGFDASSDRQTSRWIDLVEVLTGTIQNYQCQTLLRDTAFFNDLYKGSSSTAYDFLYTNPYHRPLSGTCAPRPGNDPSPPGQFPIDNPGTAADEGAINYRAYNDASGACAFGQDPDGILDAFRTGVRFGLMTFDTDPAPQTNVNGLWSYVVGDHAEGMPLGCTLPMPQEVGARNALAPAWEGRLVGFGDPSPGSTDYQTRNDQIQQIILATRPFGATPIAGMMEDARAFLLEDTNKDPLNASLDLGPKNDPYKACRKTAIILLSDGEPNMDLRPECDDDDPKGCPFDTPEKIALDLNSSTSHAPIPTHVIGFGISTFTIDGVTKSCKDIDPGPAGPCTLLQNDPGIRACCALNRIAAAGGIKPDSRAFFANTRADLKAAVASVLGEMFEPTSRTAPVPGPGDARQPAFAVSSRMLSGFSPIGFGPWSAVLERERWTCERATPNDPLLPTRQAVRADKGDDFVANVESGQGPPRLFISVSSATAGGSATSLRPNLGTDPNDGLGFLGATQYVNTAKDFADATTAAQLNITDASCPGLNATECKRRYLYWLVGLDNGTAYHRCPNPSAGECSLVGDIFHSTPRVVGPPSELIVDESYRQFALDNATRPTVLYTATNDGFLHAFKLFSNDPEDDSDAVARVATLGNNELWAFTPPAILPQLPSQYPFTHQVLLDGVPVIKDVVATENPLAPAGAYKFKLQRTLADARAGAGTWRTILLQSFGAERPGYFAVDITDPVAVAGDPNKGPRFLWQLTTDSAGNPLFGLGGVTPVITTVFIGGQEVAVAVLPGGRGGPGGAGSGSGCDRATTDFSTIESGYAPRTKVPCYSGSALTARSLTIVRLDNGQIVQTFRRSAGEVSLPSALVNVSKIDSPITGQPVAFPADAGAVADRLFVGDQDGTLWKVDLSSSTPSDWKMTLFFDAYAKASSPAYNVGQPIATPPILSVNDRNQITVNLSTGDQDALGAAPSMLNYVWSLTERPVASLNGDTGSFKTTVNWYKVLEAGERVTGPMVLFNSMLFFSTFRPTSGTCSVGESVIWSMDYLRPASSVDSGGAPTGAFAGIDPSAVSLSVDDQLLGLQAGDPSQRAAVFGVSLVQKPTCRVNDATAINQYLGYGSHTALTDVTPGGFQLMFHIGSATASGSVPGVSQSSGNANALALDLPAPQSFSRVDSWAAIVE